MAHPTPFACLRVLSTTRFPARQTVEVTLANESARALLERIAHMGSFDTVRDAGVKRGDKRPLLTAIAYPKSAAAPGGEEMRERGRLNERERSTEYLRIPLDRDAREVRRAIPPTLGPVGQPVTPLEVRGQPGATATVAWVPRPGGVGAHAGDPRVLSQEEFARPGGRQDDAEGEKHCLRQSPDFATESMNRRKRASVVWDPNRMMAARNDAFFGSLSGVLRNVKAAQGALSATDMAQALERTLPAMALTPRCQLSDAMKQAARVQVGGDAPIEAMVWPFFDDSPRDVPIAGVSHRGPGGPKPRLSRCEHSNGEFASVVSRRSATGSAACT